MQLFLYCHPSKENVCTYISVYITCKVASDLKLSVSILSYVLASLKVVSNLLFYWRQFLSEEILLVSLQNLVTIWYHISKKLRLQFYAIQLKNTVFKTQKNQIIDSNYRIIRAMSVQKLLYKKKLFNVTIKLTNIQHKRK